MTIFPSKQEEIFAEFEYLANNPDVIIDICRDITDHLRLPEGMIKNCIPGLAFVAGIFYERERNAGSGPTTGSGS